MARIKIFLLIFIIFSGVILRLYKFDSPVADWHSWRQVDTSSVSREYVKNGINLLYPKYHDLSNVPSKKENPKGYRFVEFPILNAIQAFSFKYFGIFTLEEWGRLISIFASMGTALLIFLLLRKYASENSGIIGAFFYSFLPFSIYYGRVILPDPFASFSILMGIYLFSEWIDKFKSIKNGILLFVFSAIFTSLAILLKPFTIFFVLPMIYLAYEKFGKKFLVNPFLWIFALASVVPFIGWRVWMSQFPEGIPSSAWLFNEGNIRFKGAFFNWIFAERIGKLILGYWGIGILISGLFIKLKRSEFLFFSFIISSLFYLFIIAKGNVQHDYYQILIIPTICIFLGIGGDFLVNHLKKTTYKYIGLIIFISLTLFTLSFSWFYVKEYYNTNNSIVDVGVEVDRLIPKESLVIASYNGDTTFLYHTNRKGWASYQYELEDMKNIGANYLIILNPNESDYEFGSEYRIVKNTSEFVIFNLNISK